MTTNNYRSCCWTNDRFVRQVKKPFPISEIKDPNSSHSLVFILIKVLIIGPYQDKLNAVLIIRPFQDVLNTKHMNVGPEGSQSAMHDTIWNRK